MKKLWNLLFLLFIIGQKFEVYSQIAKIKHDKVSKVGFLPIIKTDINIDSLLRTKIPNLKPCYFIFAFKLQFSEITLAPQILNDLNIAKKYLDKGHDIVFLILNNNTLSKPNYINFLQKALLLKPEEANQIKIIDEDSIYLKIQNRDNFQTTYYIFNRQLVYKQLGKASNHSYKKILEYQNFYIKKDTTILFEEPNHSEFYLKSTDKVLKIEDKFYRILHFHGIIIRYNEKGKIEQIFDINRLDPYFVYNQLVSDTFLINYAKAHNSIMKQINRPNFHLFNIFDYDKKLYILLDLEVIIPSNYSFKTVLSDGKINKIAKNQPILDSYSIILETDLDFNILQIHHVQPISKNNFLKTSIYSGNNIGMLMNDSLMLSQIIVSNRFSGYLNTGYYGIGYYQKNQNTWKLSQIIAKFDKKLSIREEWLNYINHFWVFHQDTFFTSMTLNGFYNLNKKKYYRLNPILKHNLNKEKILNVFDDKDTNFVNFYVINAAPILNNSFIGIVYRFMHKDLLLEIRDSLMNTVGIIDLTKYPEFYNLANFSFYDPTAIFLNNHFVYISYIKDDQYYLTRYKIYPYSFNKNL